MSRIRLAVLGLALIEAGWMLFDGTRALVLGDYVAPGGELGPWAALVEAVGIPARSTGMKLFFALYGASWLACAAWFHRSGARAQPAARASGAMMAFAAGALWYLPIGTLLSLAQLALLARLMRADAKP